VAIPYRTIVAPPYIAPFHAFTAYPPTFTLVTVFPRSFAETYSVAATAAHPVTASSVRGVNLRAWYRAPSSVSAGKVGGRRGPVDAERADGFWRFQHHHQVRPAGGDVLNRVARVVVFFRAFRFGLRHFAVQLAALRANIDRDFARAQIQHDAFNGPPPEAQRCAERRVPGEVEFTGGREDPRANTFGLCFGGGAAEDERGFRKIRFARDGQHLLRVQSIGVGEDPQRIAREASIGEYVPVFEGKRRFRSQEWRANALINSLRDRFRIIYSRQAGSGSWLLHRPPQKKVPAASPL